MYNKRIARILVYESNSDDPLVSRGLVSLDISRRVTLSGMKMFRAKATEEFEEAQDYNGIQTNVKKTDGFFI